MNISDNQKQLYFMLSFIIIYLLYFITFLGFINIKPYYITNFRSVLQAISCILLMIRFNPFVNHTITNFDKSMIFSVASFLLFNIVISELYYRYSENPVVNTLNKLQIHKDISAN